MIPSFGQLDFGINTAWRLLEFTVEGYVRVYLRGSMPYKPCLRLFAAMLCSWVQFFLIMTQNKQPKQSLAQRPPRKTMVYP